MTQKEIAIKAMKALNIYAPYIKKFKTDGTITLFERFGGYYINEHQEPELLDKIRSFEKETGSLVYAVTHENFWFGECYSFLCVSKYEEDWDFMIDIGETESYVWGYAWNKDNEICSEYGTMVFQSFGGGITRIG